MMTLPCTSNYAVMIYVISVPIDACEKRHVDNQRRANSVYLGERKHGFTAFRRLRK